MSKNKYRPRAKDVLKTPPGEILHEFVSCGEFTAQQIAEGLDISLFHVFCLFDGSVKINARLAKGLEKVIGRPAQFWLNLQAQYDKALKSENPRRRIK